MTQELTKAQKMFDWLFEEGAIGVATADIAGRVVECIMSGETEVALAQDKWKEVLYHPSVWSYVNGNIVPVNNHFVAAYLTFFGMKFYCVVDRK